MNAVSKQNNKNQWIAFMTILCLLFLAISCKDKDEGCRDIAASNWDAQADKSCDECCTYPELKLTFTHVFADTSFNYGDPFLDDSMNVYTLLSVRYYLSDVFLKNGTQEFSVTDSLEADVSIDGITSEQTLHDDVAYITKGTSTTSIGSFPNNDLFIDSLLFRMGVVQPLNSVIPTSVVTSHPLAPKADSMYWDASRGYIFQRLLIVRDIAAREAVLLEIGGDALPQAVSLPIAKEIRAGTDATISVKVDYKIWFKGINFAEDTPEEMKEKIVTNMAESFSFLE